MIGAFFAYGYQLPLYARCTGILAGDTLALVLMVLGVWVEIGIALAMIIPLAIDGGAQYAFGLESTNARRLLTAVIAGVGGMYVLAGLARLLLGLILG